MKNLTTAQRITAFVFISLIVAVVTLAAFNIGEFDFSQLAK